MKETIFALSSGAPPAAIAVLRVSGPKAHEVLESVAGKLPPLRTMVLRTVRDPESGEVLDRGLVVAFPGDSSVTGEPLVELHLHGGRAIVDRVGKTLTGIAGVRRAQAGEFTWRAFENGRLNLVQVEGLSDLLRAETEAQRRAALAEEGLSGLVDQWRRQLLHISAQVEAALDQSDEGDVTDDRSQASDATETLLEQIAEWLRRPGTERLFDGLRVVFAGRPNVGKSSLINALSGKDAAITSPIAGTTRDVIEVPVQIGGVAFILTDTAGLRAEGQDPIERIGIDRARQRIDGADLVVWMDDEGEPAIADDRLVHVFARADQPDRRAARSGLLRVSAVTGEGLAELASLLVERARLILPREGEIALTRRQREHLVRCHQHLIDMVGEPDELIIAERLRLARSALDELTGRAGTEEMLDSLFGMFCVGK